MDRSRSISGLVCLAIIFICVTRTVAHDDQDANRQRAEALWEEAIRAKGGRERLHSIESFVISSSIDAHAVPSAFDNYSPRRDVESEAERLYVMPGKAWLYEFTPAFAVSLEATVI